MTFEIIILLIALLFFIVGAFLYKGKSAWLIAGYNTASKEEKAKYDKKKLCKAISVVCFVCSIMLCFMAYEGYKVDTGAMD